MTGMGGIGRSDKAASGVFHQPRPRLACFCHNQRRTLPKGALSGDARLPWGLIVDAFCLGRQGGGVLSFVQFLTEVQVGCAYAILQGGRHSHVGEFTRTAKGKPRAQGRAKAHKEVR